MCIPLNKKLHVLYLIDELVVKGGTESHLLDLARGMVERGHRITVMCLSEGEFANLFKYLPGVFYECLNVKRIYDWKGIKALERIRSFIKLNKVDILQSFHTASDLIAPLAGRLACTGVRIISSRRDLGYTKSRRHLRAQRIVNNFVHGILANSEAVKTQVVNQEGFSFDLITVIYNGIHTERFAEPAADRKKELAETLGIAESRFVVGSVGNLRPVKGYRYLIEAASMLCPKHQQLLFLVAGDGDIRKDLEDMCIEFGVSHQFCFVGSIREIPEFLSCLDIYVQPSLTEGFSNAVLEAMAGSLPVVATSVGGNSEVIDNCNNGLLVEAGNPKLLAEAIQQLIIDKESRRRMSEEGRKTVVERFSIIGMMDRYEKYYRG